MKNTWLLELIGVAIAFRNDHTTWVTPWGNVMPPASLP